MQTRWHTQAERLTEGPGARLDSGGTVVAIAPNGSEGPQAADRVRVEGRFLRAADRVRGQAQPHSAPPRSSSGVTSKSERRRWERDLHDGVQSELVSLLLRLRLAEQDPSTPAAVAETFAALTEHALAALDSLREITYGIYPRALAKLGVRDTLLSRAARATVDVTIEGTAPRSTEEAEEAIYFACSEAIQNAIKHAGEGTQVSVSLQYHHGSLAVRVADGGQGFDPAAAAQGAGLQNIRERVRDLDGSFAITSRRGRGTVLSIALAWPPRAERRPHPDVA